jgi:hypothetical protein
MATTTTATVRRKNARRLLELYIKHDALFTEIDSLKATLIAEAAKDGESFKEFFDKVGKVSVSAPAPARCTGTEYVVDQSKFLELTDAQKKKLTDDGLIEQKEVRKREYSGRCEVKVLEA